MRYVIVPCMAGVLAAPSALGQVVEETEDGRDRVVVAPAATDNCGWSIESSVPFPLTPGWTLNLRRQVGVVRVGDLNGDDRNDLFVGCYTSNSFPPYDDWHDMIFYNTGDPGAPLPATPSWICAEELHTGDGQLGDINGDGALDIVAITGGTAFNPVRMYLGAPGGPATTPAWVATPPQAGWPTGGMLFDIDRDDDLDLFTTNQGVAGVRPEDAWRPMHFFRNVGGMFETSPSWLSAEISIQNTAAPVDYDNDGDLDVAVAKWVNFESGIYRNDGGTLETTMAWGVGTTGTDRGAAAGDVDDDGDTDLALYLGNVGTRIYENTPQGLSPGSTTTPPFFSAQEIALNDVDQDGDLDVLEVHFGDGRAHLYLNDAGVVGPAPDWTFDASEVGNAIALGDLNGDGWDDLVVGYSGNTSVRVFFALPQVVPCVADLSGASDPNDPAYGVPDGALDAADFFYYLDQFVASNVAVADLTTTSDPSDPGYGTPDGIIDAADFFYYLDLFVAGCP
ncbi:MAG: VCBS repeat-containing protein [Phycisphaerales bacterium]|nr:VCBS repeat-containing protein [Phycisphaerales bacterium]